MLEKIKSKYITKMVFDYLQLTVKLKIIKTNKELLNKLEITKYDYMVSSGKYIKYKSKTKVKEYNFDGEVIFIGEYKNGKRNGKGKEFGRFNDLYYEGQYLNGKRHGMGKEFYYKKVLKCKGEYLNGKLWNGIIYDKKHQKYDSCEIKNGKGYVKEYDFYGEKVFEGEYVNGERNGKGKEYKFTSLIFEGYYINGKRNGKGKNFRYSKVRFEGNFKNGMKWDGVGYDSKNNIMCKFENGKGFIKEYSNLEDTILQFEGEFCYGEGNGKAKEYDKNGKLIYEGGYLNGKRNGAGKEYTESNKLKFEGEYYNNQKLKGKEYNKGRLEFEGNYLNNKKWNGKGYNSKGNVCYELINGNGKVKEYDKDGNLIFEGEYLNGIRNGKGKEYENDWLAFEGEYYKGKKHGKGMEHFDFEKKEVIYNKGERVYGNNCILI